MSKFVFEYKIFPVVGDTRYRLEICKQDDRIPHGCVCATTKGWQIWRSCTVEVDKLSRVIYIIGSSNQSIGHSFNATPAQVEEIKSVLEEFKISYCGYSREPKAHNHPLTDMFTLKPKIKQGVLL